MSRPLKIVLAILLVLVLGIGGFVAQLFWFAPEIVVSKETTWLTEPLADDGLPDYAAYLLKQGRQGVTPENNGAIPFLQAMWPAQMDRAQQIAVCKELGMSVPTKNGLRDPTSDKQLFHATERWLEEQGAMEADSPLRCRVDEMDRWAGCEPWRREDHPRLAEWLENHAEEFQLLHLAGKRPEFHAPSPTHLLTPMECQSLTLLTFEQSIHIASDCLGFRAMLRLGEGDFRGAWEDAEGVYALARQVPRGSLVADIISYGIERTSHELTKAILAEPDLPIELAREILQAYRQRPDRALAADTVDRFERLAYASTVLSLAGLRPFDLDGTLSIEALVDLGIQRHGINWNVPLRAGTEWYDRLVAAMTLPTPQARHAAIEGIEVEWSKLRYNALDEREKLLWSRTSRSKLAGDICVLSLFPSPAAALKAEEGVNTDRLLHKIAAALAIYRIEHNEYPETLKALVPEPFAEEPVDLYGQPFVYRRTENGYLLYSLGHDGIDNQGSNKILSVFEGYDVGRGDEEVRQSLGLPSRPKAEMLEADQEDVHDPALAPLKSQIPTSADDWGIRLPLPKDPAAHRQAGAPP